MSKSFKLMLGLTLLLVLIPSMYAFDLTTNLTHYWNTSDMVINQYNDSVGNWDMIVSASAQSKWAPAYYVQGFNTTAYTANTDKIEAAALDLDAQIVTVSFFLNKTTEVTGYVWQYSVDAGASETMQLLTLSSGVLRFQSTDVGGGCNCEVFGRNNSYDHYIFSRNGSNLKLWQNGTLMCDSSCATTSTASTDAMHFGGDGGNSVAASVDEIAIWEHRYFSDSDAADLWNLGNPYVYDGGVWTVSGDSTSPLSLDVGLVSPPDSSANNSVTQNFIYNITWTGMNLTSCELYTNYSTTWQSNQTNTSPVINDTDNTFTMNNLEDGQYSWNVICSNSTGYESAPNNFTFTVDSQNPLISPETNLGNNKSFVWNGTLESYIDFSDNNEIYSINITWWNGTRYYNVSNFGYNYSRINISSIINPSGTLNLTARVCDAHTAKEIKDIKKIKKDKEGVKFIMDEFLWFDTEWIHIYPKEYSKFDEANYEKKKDRYKFGFKKNSLFDGDETFIIESSDFIDITKMQLYTGHLVIPGIDNGYWVDFENYKTTDYTITRISDTKIEITLHDVGGLSYLEFNSLGELNCVSRDLYFVNLNPTTTYTSPVLIGQQNTVYLNITESPIINLSFNATLFYNGTLYNSTTINNFSREVTAPTFSTGNFSNVSLYWKLYVDSNPYDLTTYNQSLSNFFLDDCSVAETIAANFSIWDESDTSTQIDSDWSGTFNYQYGNFTKGYTLTRTAENYTNICVFPNWVSFDLDNYSIFYEATGYPQRRYYSNDDTFNNETQQIKLYLLGSSLGIYARFQVVDAYSNSLSGVQGTMKRDFGVGYVTVEQENTDDSGLATFWVNPDEDYQFTFSLAPYGSETFVLRPTTSEVYTVVLGSSVASVNKSYSEGLNYTFTPTGDLTNNTVYNLAFSLSSSYWTLTGCTFNIKDGDTIINTTTGYTSTTCSLNRNFDSTGYNSITAEAVYNLNGTPQTVSKVYSIRDRYEGQFSLRNLIDDIVGFSGAGFNDFTRMFIAFIIIIGIVGGVAYKADLRDPESLILLTIGLTWLMSYFGFLTLNYGPIPTDWLKKYIIAILVSFAGGSYLLKKVTD